MPCKFGESGRRRSVSSGGRGASFFHCSLAEHPCFEALPCFAQANAASLGPRRAMRWRDGIRLGDARRCEHICIVRRPMNPSCMRDGPPSTVVGAAGNPHVHGPLVLPGQGGCFMCSRPLERWRFTEDNRKRRFSHCGSLNVGGRQNTFFVAVAHVVGRVSRWPPLYGL